MMQEGKRKSATACLAAGFILTCYLAQTVDCFGLQKVERRGRKEANAGKTIGYQEGNIVFGRGSSLAPQVVDGTGKVSSNASAEDEAAYQADFTGWSKGHAHDASSKEASWKRMAPTLQCGGDQMKFRAVGPGASQFAVEQGNASPMPLSQVPSTCGYSMQRNSLALVMLVPFDGCNIVQEGGNYMLPMRWQGVPVSLLCPKPVASAPTTAEPHHPVPQTPGYLPYPLVPPVKHPGANPQNPFFYPPYMQYPMYPPTTTTTTTTKKPDVPKIPPYYYPLPPFFPPPPPVTTAAPTTAATTKAPPPVFPPFYPPYLFPWPLPGPPPTTPAPTTTTTQATKPQSPPPFPPYFPPFQFPPFQFPPFQFPPFPVLPPYYPTPKPQTTTPTPTTTTSTTTTAKPGLTPPAHIHPHVHPHVHLPYPFLYPPHFPPQPMQG